MPTYHGFYSILGERLMGVRDWAGSGRVGAARARARTNKFRTDSIDLRVVAVSERRSRSADVNVFPARVTPVRTATPRWRPLPGEVINVVGGRFKNHAHELQARARGLGNCVPVKRGLQRSPVCCSNEKNARLCHRCF